MTSQKKRHSSWQLALTMAVLCFLFGLAGVLCLLTSATGGTNDTFSLSDTAVPIRDVNGLTQDEEGNYYIGCGGSSSIQVFDREGRFLRRLCIPTYKAGSTSFAWKLEGETLRVYTYRGPACLTVEGTEVIKTETYPDSDALRAAMEADGLSPYGGGRSGTGADGSLLRLDLLGRLRVTEPDGTRRTRSAGGWRWWGSSGCSSCWGVLPGPFPVPAGKSAGRGLTIPAISDRINLLLQQGCGEVRGFALPREPLVAGKGRGPPLKYTAELAPKRTMSPSRRVPGAPVTARPCERTA